jgi:DNA polymerase elongation subunit (family B)
MLDQLLLQEAKNNGIVLPMKPSEERGTLTEKEEFEGAYREIFKSGRFTNVGKYDLGSAYPQMIKEFCLDTSNIRNQKEKDCLEINNTYFKQNNKTILPLVVNKLLTLKSQLKEKLSILDPSTQEYKDLDLKYKGTKSLVNSAYGVFGNRFFRLYDKRVASATTFLVRSVLKYIIEKLEEKNYEVIYADTDSVMIDNNTTDISDLLNELIQQWAKETYGKEKIDLEFTYEGNFDKLLLLALCRYVGYLKTETGIKKEICGVEIRRKDSTKFLKKFQEKLIDKILNGGQEKDIIEWIKLQILQIKQVPLEDIAFPCKLSRSSDAYKNKPIFVRALENSKDFNKKVGDAFYYIFIIPDSYEVKIKTVEMLDGKKLTPSKLKDPWKEYFQEEILVKNMSIDKKEELINYLERQGRITVAKVETKGKAIDVLAFDEENKAHIDKKRIDWTRVIERNIISKCEVIFEAMKWNLGEIRNEKM